MSKACAVPGCPNKLWSGNLSGVCRGHNHSEHCRCSNCLNPQDYPPPGPSQKYEVRPEDDMEAEGLIPPKGQRLVLSNEPSVKDLCRPLSAKVEPDYRTRWASISVSQGDRSGGRSGRSAASQKRWNEKHMVARLNKRLKSDAD